MRTAVTVSSKGQITLPAKVRKALSIEAGDRLSVAIDRERGSVELTRIDRFDSLRELHEYLAPLIEGIEPVTDVDAYYQTHRSVEQS